MSTLTLDIAPCAGGGWSGRWSCDGHQVGTPIELGGNQASGLREVGKQFAQVYETIAAEGAPRPLLNPEKLQSFGLKLRETWLDPRWDKIQASIRGPGPHDLLIVSSEPEILNLPWELVELLPGLPLGCDANWSLRRMPAGAQGTGDLPLAPGPLRILFLAAAPRDQAQLFYEREEAAILDATGHLPDRVILHFSETGSFDELAELVPQCKPHVVHLSGHGTVDRSGRGLFAFEDERGGTDSCPADVLVGRIFRGSSVRCVFLNACLTSQATAAGLCQSLVAAGLPLAVGWSAKVADDRATEFAAEFYRQVVSGEPVTVAAAHAQDMIRRSGQDRQGPDPLQDATFAMPQVYGSVSPAALFDRSAPLQTYEGPRSEPFLLGDGIVGLKRGYIGRRREGQRLFPALRQGDVIFAVLQGIGGAGKSTLATRAANRLQGQGFRLVPVRTPSGSSPGEVGASLLSKLRGALGRAFQQAGRDDLVHLLTSDKIAPEDQLRHAIDALNELRLALLIDNFEDALEPETRRIADTELASSYTALATNLTRGSRVLVTTRYLPAGTPIHLPTVLHLPLPDFDESDFIKFLRCDDRVKGRIRRGELSKPLLERLFKSLGGTPGFLDQIRTLLRKPDIEELIAELEGEPGTLGEAREAYLQKILAARLFEALSSEARGVVCRVAVSELPIPDDAVAAITGHAPEPPFRLLDEGVALGLLQRLDEEDLPALYQVPGLLRPWLLATERISEESVRAVHRRLAAFWRASYEADREQELRVPIDVELLVCRSHAHQGGDVPNLCWASNVLVARLERRSDWRAARTLLEEIPEADRDVVCRVNLANLRSRMGEGEGARLDLEGALELQLSDADRARILHNLATIDLDQGKYDDPRSRFDEALRIQRDIGNRAGVADSLHNLATIDLDQGKYDDARNGFQEALRIRRDIGDRAGVAASLHQLASIDLVQGKYDDDRNGFQEALQVQRDIGNRQGEAATLHQLASIDLNQGKYDDARAQSDEALRVNRGLGDRAGVAATLHQLASIDLVQGKYDDSRARFDEALRIRRDIRDRRGEAASLHNLASIDVYQGKYDDARARSDEALRIKRDNGDRAGEAASLHQLGALAHKLGRGHEGAILVAMSLPIFLSVGHADAEHVLRNLGGLCEQLGYDQKQIESVFQEAASEYQRDGGQSLVERTFAGLRSEEQRG